MNLISNSYNCMIKEAVEVVTTQSYNIRLNKAVSLCQPGYSAERNQGFFFFSSISDE